MTTLETVKHPLVTKQFTTITSREVWLARWDAAQTAEEMVGLLKCGLRLPTEGELCAQLIFYFDIADEVLLRSSGGGSDKALLTNSLSHEGKTTHQLRLFIAETAKKNIDRDYYARQPSRHEDTSYSMLFYDNGGRFGGSAWSPVMYSSDGVALLKRLLQYFHAHHVPVNESENSKQFSVRFAEWMLKEWWVDKVGKIPHYADETSWRALQLVAESAVPQIVSMLCGMDFQYGSNYLWRMLRSAKPAVQERALSAVHDAAIHLYPNGSSVHKTVEEAFVNGSREAEAYFLLKMKLVLKNPE